MRRSLPFACVLALASPSCRVRGASTSDLVGEVPNAPASKADAAAAAPPRLELVCTKPPVTEDSKVASVPDGTFRMGCNPQIDEECSSDEEPAHDVHLAAFGIDTTEVTQGQYYACVAAKKCAAPACDWDPCEDGKRKDHPVVCVNRADATAYCAWKGGRLPTEAEWERAARGDDGRKYPWGNDGLDCAHANLASCPGPNGAPPGTLPVGSLAVGASPYGVLDLAGNVGEWTNDYYDPTYYAESPMNDPPGPPKAARFVGRGGAWRSTGVWIRASKRDDYEAEYVKDSMGFRCAH